MLKIANIQGDLSEAINELNFDSLVLSDGSNVSDVFSSCLEHKIYAHIGDSKKKFIRYFKKSLSFGSCNGQVHSFFLHGCGLRDIRTISHVVDSIVLQMLYELKYDIKKLLNGDFIKSPIGNIKERLPFGLGTTIGFQLTHEKQQACHKLVKEIKSITDKLFSKFMLKEKFYIKGVYNLCDPKLLQLDTKELENVLFKYAEVQLLGTVEILDEKDDEHAFAIVKRDNVYSIYNACNFRGYILERSSDLPSILNEFRKLVTYLYDNHVDRIAFKVYVPHNKL
jgi:hypothetical protein